MSAALARIGLVALLAGATASTTATAAERGTRVDDSASTVVGGAAAMRWDSGAPGPGRAQTMSGEVTVIARLDLAPWRGRNARVYLALPAQPFGPVAATWTTRGRLLPGALRAGERALVFAGPVVEARLEDTLRLRLETAGAHLERAESLQFHFEIDAE